MINFIDLGPGAIIPSRLHASIAVPLLKNIERFSPSYSLFHEFSGLYGKLLLSYNPHYRQFYISCLGGYDVDIAVFYEDNLVALVEIDGRFHYRQLDNPSASTKAAVGINDDDNNKNAVVSATSNEINDNESSSDEGDIDGTILNSNIDVASEQFTLRRKDLMKEFLYRKRYPNVPLYRRKVDDIEAVGYSRAGKALASQIHTDYQKKLSEVSVN